MDFFAHSTARVDKVDWQLLSEHLSQVGSLARLRGDAFGAGDMACVAGLLHDLGKYTARFQRRLEGDPMRVTTLPGALRSHESIMGRLANCSPMASPGIMPGWPTAWRGRSARP